MTYYFWGLIGAMGFAGGWYLTHDLSRAIHRRVLERLRMRRWERELRRERERLWLAVHPYSVNIPMNEVESRWRESRGLQKW